MSRAAGPALGVRRSAFKWILSECSLTRPGPSKALRLAIRQDLFLPQRAWGAGRVSGDEGNSQQLCRTHPLVSAKGVCTNVSNVYHSKSSPVPTQRTFRGRSTGQTAIGRGKITLPVCRVNVRSYRARLRSYGSLAYSALASFRMGMSGSASFQSVSKSS